jgi:hypothetical protein
MYMNNDKRHRSWKAWSITIVLGIFLNADLVAQSTMPSKEPANAILSSVRSDNADTFDGIADQLKAKNEKLVSELIFILTNTKSSNYQRCSSAYYLGEMHAAEAAEALATNITLIFTGPEDHLSILDYPPAVEALFKISTPSIQPIIQNLGNTDDAKVRKLSLQVLYRIEGDKDIVQLRLQKALQSESNPTKQARLQSALKALAEASF